MAVTDGSIVSGSSVKSILGETGSSNDAIISLSIRRAEGAVIRYLKYDPVQRLRTEFYPLSEAQITRGAGVWEATATQAIFKEYGGVSGSELQLKHVPLRSAALDVRVDYNARAGTASGSFASATQQVEGSDFWPNYNGIDSDGNSYSLDGILRAQGSWPTSPGSIKITYTAGYSANELQGIDNLVNAAAIWDATLEEAVHRAREAILKKKSATIGYTAGPKIEERLGDYSYRISDSLSKELFGVHSFDLMRSSMVSLEEFVNYGYSMFA